MLANTLAVAVRLATPHGTVGALSRFLALLAMIHLLSLAAEYALVGLVSYSPVVRLAITTIAATPFLALGLFSFKLAGDSRRRLREMAMTDMLTELPNRRAFLDTLDEAAALGRTGYLAILDADDFKQINDTYGHETGDRALKAIACQMRALSGSDIRFARVGGEEFGLLLTGARADESLALVEGVLCPAITYGVDRDGTPMRLSLSAGVTRFAPLRPVSDLLREADGALYRAKSQGRGRLVRWSDLPGTPGSFVLRQRLV